MKNAIKKLRKRYILQRGNKYVSCLDIKMHMSLSDPKILEGPDNNRLRYSKTHGKVLI